MGRQRWRTTCGGVPRTNFNFLRVRESLSSRGAVLTTCLEGGGRGGGVGEMQTKPKSFGEPLHTYKRVLQGVSLVSKRYDSHR